MNDKPTLLVVDGDATLCDALARGFTGRDFHVRTAHSVEEAERRVAEDAPQYTVIDLALAGGAVLELVSSLVARDRGARIVVLTCHGSIPGAVEAIKLGATDPPAWPASVDDVAGDIHPDASDDAEPIDASLRRHEWAYIRRVLRQHGGNIAATARALSMHRRTLQRKIAKHPAPG
jgi:two-component system response regulator RegA